MLCIEILFWRGWGRIIRNCRTCHSHGFIAIRVQGTDHIDRKLSRNYLRLWNDLRGVCKATIWMDMGVKRREHLILQCQYQTFPLALSWLHPLFTPLCCRLPDFMPSARAQTAHRNSRSAARLRKARILDSFRSRWSVRWPNSLYILVCHSVTSCQISGYHTGIWRRYIGLSYDPNNSAIN